MELTDVCLDGRNIKDVCCFAHVTRMKIGEIVICSEEYGVSLSQPETLHIPNSHVCIGTCSYPIGESSPNFFINFGKMKKCDYRRTIKQR